MSYSFAGIAEDPQNTTCTPIWIARVLGRKSYSTRRLSAYLQALVDNHGFPAPLPSLAGNKIVTGVHKDSVFMRAAVEQWLADQLTPAAQAALDQGARTDAMAEMDNAAGSLHLVGGTRA